MAGLLDELSKYKFNPNATSMGLLQAGAQMLANSGPSYQPQGGFGSALGQGLGGFTQGYMGFNQNQLEQQKMQQQLAALDPEYQRQKILNEAKAKAEAAKAFPIAEPQKLPMGFTSNEDGSITPMPISGADGIKNYADYQLAIAQQKAMMPGYGEPERLQLAFQDQALQQDAAARSAQAQQAQMQMEAERLRLSQQAAERQDQQAKEAKLQNVPATHKMAYVENAAALKKIDDTIDAIKSNPEALGIKNMLGDTISQRLDEKGVPTRASVAEVGRVKLHDLSGAAVSASEAPGLMPLIPSVNDSAEAAVEKLLNLRKHYEEINGQFESMYSGSGYRDPIKAASKPPAQNTPPPANTGGGWSIRRAE
jgi:hypothetical protein